LYFRAIVLKRIVYILIFFAFSLELNAQLVIRSDGSWKAVGAYQTGWKDPWFNDDAWPNSLSPSPWTISPIVAGSQSMWVSPFSDTTYFRKSFFLKGECVTSSCQISADNEFELYLNDSLVGIGRNLGLIYSFNLTPFLRIGKNTIAIKAANWNTGPYLVSFLANVDYTSAPEIQISSNDTTCPNIGTSFRVYQNYQSYKWSNGDTNQQIFTNDPGLYYVETIDNNACLWADSARLVNYDLNEINLGADRNICEDDTVQLNLQGFLAYQWNTEDTGSSIVVDKSGTYGLIAMDSNLCASSDSMRVRVFSFAEISLGNDRVLCKGDTALISASFPQSVYQWSTGSQKEQISVMESGNYRVTITNFCGSASDDVNLFFTDLSTFSLLDDTLICEGTSIELDTKVENASYSWSTGDSTKSLTVSEPGTYSVRVEDNCGNQAFDEINIYREPDYSAIVPNAFSPNLDGTNENFRAFIPNGRGFKMSIFDRWGKQLFFTNSAFDAWDGTFKDEPMPNGMYLYEISYFDCLFQPQLDNGIITLIR